MSVYSLTQYVKIIQQAYYKGNKAEARKYYKVYQEQGGVRDFESIIEVVKNKFAREKKVKATRKKVVNKIKNYFGF